MKWDHYVSCSLCQIPALRRQYSHVVCLCQLYSLCAFWREFLLEVNAATSNPVTETATLSQYVHVSIIMLSGTGIAMLHGAKLGSLVAFRSHSLEIYKQQ